MVGIPYKFRGNTLKGMGCFQLVQHYFKEELNIEIDFDQFREVEKQKMHDVVLFENKDMFHCGVMISKDFILSTDENVKSSHIVKLKSHQQFDKIKKVFRHESIL